MSTYLNEFMSSLVESPVITPESRWNLRFWNENSHNVQTRTYVGDAEDLWNEMQSWMLREELLHGQATLEVPVNRSTVVVDIDVDDTGYSFGQARNVRQRSNYSPLFQSRPLFEDKDEYEINAYWTDADALVELDRPCMAF